MPKKKESVLKLGKIFPAALFFCLASGDTSEKLHQPGQMAATTFLESYIFAYTRSWRVPEGSECELPAKSCKMCLEGTIRYSFHIN